MKTIKHGHLVSRFGTICPLCYVFMGGCLTKHSFVAVRSLTLTEMSQSRVYHLWCACPVNHSETGQNSESCLNK
jgi:hypothetical protein